MLDRTVAPPFGAVKFESFKEVSLEKLSAGIPIYSLKSGEQGVVRFDLKLNSGSWYETQKSVAWFTAKMLLEGCASKTSSEISKGFESMGAFVDIEPGFDQISISIYGMRRNFTDVLELLLEVLNTPTFPSEELVNLRDIRADELKMNDAKSNMLASKKIRAALFGLSHPYGKALKAEDIHAIEQPLIANYYKNSFFNEPEIFVSGDFGEELISWIESNFKIPKANAVNSNSNIEINPTPNIFSEKKDSMQSSIRLGWNCPDMSSPDHFDFSIATTLFGGYFGSRLMKNIREDKGYTYGINAYPVHLKHHSFSIIGADVKAEYTQATLTEIWKEIDKLVTQPTPDEEINMVVNYLAGKFQSSLSTPLKLMDKFKKIHHAGLGYAYYENYFDALKSFNNAKLKDCMEKYFDAKNTHQVVVGLLEH